MSGGDDTRDDTRAIEVETEIHAPPEEVWKILTTSDGLKQWFPLDATVEPRVGGTVWLSWGPGCEGKAPIHIWEPPRRMGWTESYGEDESGKPIKVTVDFHVEGRDGVTVVRIVQSGFSAAAEWDEMYDAIKDGWTYFIFNLGYYFLKHRGQARKLIWERVATDLSRDAVWDRLIGGALVGIASGGGGDFQLNLDQPYTGQVVAQREGRFFTGTLQDLDDSVLFVELEGSHVGIWLSTYGMENGQTAALQNELTEQVEQALAAGVQVREAGHYEAVLEDGTTLP